MDNHRETRPPIGVLPCMGSYESFVSSITDRRDSSKGSNKGSNTDIDMDNNMGSGGIEWN